MKLAIFAFVVDDVFSQHFLRISQCGFRDTSSQCNSAHACTWCTSATFPSGCYRQSFTKSFAPGALKCAGTAEQNVKIWTDSPDDDPQFLGYGYPANKNSENPPPAFSLGPSRRTVGLVLGGGALGLPWGKSSAAPNIKADRRPDAMTLVTFDGAEETTYLWSEVNDPRWFRCIGDTTISKEKLIFDGNVAINPFMMQPGFISTQTARESLPFPDVSSCEGISFIAKSRYPYKGYRFGFGDGYKASFTPPLKDFGTVEIPFKDFTDSWDDVTRKPIKTCQESSGNCPNQKTLQDLKTLSFWGEGFKGAVHLEVKEIGAYGCNAKISTFAMVNEASGTIFCCILAAASVGFLVFFSVRNRPRLSPLAPPLLR